MSYSYDIQAKVYDRMTELEEKEKERLAISARPSSTTLTISAREFHGMERDMREFRQEVRREMQEVRQEMRSCMQEVQQTTGLPSVSHENVMELDRYLKVLDFYRKTYLALGLEHHMDNNRQYLACKMTEAATGIDLAEIWNVHYTPHYTPDAI